MTAHEERNTGFTIDELRTAFVEYQRLGALGRDWPAWAALFTDDATYVEHCMGKFHGAQAIREWILSAMDPVACMTFSFDWAILQPPHIAFNVWNHMPDPTGGDGRYSFSNLTLITYAGNGKWNWEEDFYAPKGAGKTVSAWYRAGGQPTMAANPSITHVSLTPEPTTEDSNGVVAMVRAWQAGAPVYAADAHVWDHATGSVPGADAAPFNPPADLVLMDAKRAFLRCGETGVALTHAGSGRIAFEERAHNPTEVP